VYTRRVLGQEKYFSRMLSYIHGDKCSRRRATRSELFIRESPSIRVLPFYWRQLQKDWRSVSQTLLYFISSVMQ
jgi:hypothetical protein